MITAANDSATWGREEVYELVWSQPMTKLVPIFGICDRAIAKNCHKLQIPFPGRGYWARKANGYSDPQKPLPKLHERPKFEWRRRQAPEPQPTPPPQPPTVEEVEDQREIEQINDLLASGALVPKSPGKAKRHPLLTATRKAFYGGRGSAMTAPPRHALSPLNVNVTKSSQRRALDIVGTVIAILEQQGVKVRTDERRNWATIFGQDVFFKITERRRKLQRPPAKPGDKSDLFRSNFDLEPTGELTFHILSGYEFTLHRWSDRANRKIEQGVPEIVAGILRTGVRLRREAENKRLEHERQQRRIEELRLLKNEIEAEEKRVAQLEKRADSWRRATLIRDYAQAVLNYHAQRGSDIAPESEVGRWMTWALQQADRVDPLAESPTSIIDRKVELQELPPWWR